MPLRLRVPCLEAQQSPAEGLDGLTLQAELTDLVDLVQEHRDQSMVRAAGAVAVTPTVEFPAARLDGSALARERRPTASPHDTEAATDGRTRRCAAHTLGSTSAQPGAGRHYALAAATETEARPVARAVADGDAAARPRVELASKQAAVEAAPGQATRSPQPTRRQRRRAGRRAGADARAATALERRRRPVRR